MDAASALHKAAVSPAEGVRKQAPPTPVAQASSRESSPEPLSSMTTSSKNLPNGTASSASSAVGSAPQSAQVAAAHATTTTNVWATRSQKQRLPPVSNGIVKEPLHTPTESSSASMSRSSSRKAKVRGAELPQLDDPTAWPDVRETLQTIAGRTEKEPVERTASSSSSQKKEKTKWVHLPAEELQAAFDANRAHQANRQRTASKTQSQPRSLASSTHSLAQSSRTSPHLNARPKALHDDTQPTATVTTVSPNSTPSTSQAAPSHPPRPAVPQSHPLPERPVVSKPRRPTPNKSRPVEGLLPVQEAHNPGFKPLFGSFPDRLPVNTTPKLGSLGEDLSVTPLESPPSPSLFGPGGPLERETKQRGKVAIGVEGSTSDVLSASATNDDAQSTVGQDQDGWFVVDADAGKRVLESHSRPRLEFGQFGSSNSVSSRGDYRGPSSNRRQGPNGNHDGYRNGRDGRRPSVSESMTNGVAGAPYRHSSQPVSGSGPRRGSGGRGGQRGNAGSNAYAGGPRSGAGYSTARSMSSGNNYRQPSTSTTRPYGPPLYDPTETYAVPMAGQEYNQYYMVPGSPGAYTNPYWNPYGGYTVPVIPPVAPYGAPAAAPVAPPVPMPITQLAYQLDPLRYWLLGQLEYYFSLQNLATDLFLRRQMDSEGWLDIALIASFNRVQHLTQDYNLVRDTMGLSAYLEVTEDKVRLAHRRWQEFVLPPTPSSVVESLPGLASLPAPLPSLAAAPAHYNGSLSAAAYSLAASLSGLTLTGDDAATIQAKVTEAVLGTKSTMRQIAETHGRHANGDASSSSNERDESSSSTTAGSLTTDPTPAATSPPSSPGSITADTLKPIPA